MENKLDNKFTSTEIIRLLKGMNFHLISVEGCTPAYTRTDLADALYEAFGFHTDY